MTRFLGARALVIPMAASGAVLSLFSIAQSPRAQIITYADGENRTAPIDISQFTQLQVATGTAVQSGVISQSNAVPQLQKAGAGTLIFTGANTYSNQTVLLGGGALNIQNNTALGATGDGAVANGTIVVNGAALEMQGNITVGAEALLLNGTGIGGGGALRNISGNNTYGGAITLNSATRINADAGTLTVSRNIDTIGAGQNLTVGGAGDTTILGVIATDGALTKDGTGTLTLMGPNFYTGVTTVSAGALNIRNGAALGIGAGGTTVASGAALELQQSFSGPGIVVSEALTLNGTGIANGGALRSISGNNTYIRPITLGSAARIIADADTLTVSGTIGGFGQNLTVGGAGNITISGIIGIGTGSLTKDGTGTLILTSTNSYTGGTVVNGGTLQGNTSSLQGNILNNANVTFNQLAEGTYAGVMSGGGRLTKIGASTLILTGNNTYSGGTAVEAGTLQGTTTSLQGDILNNANVTFNQLAEGAYGGVMSGSGSLTKTGAGTLILTGANAYTGGTSALGGTLSGSTVSLQGNILNNANVRFDQAADGTYGGVMSGSGSLTKDGAGTLILTGANTYTGGTSVLGGILQGNTSSLQGNILNDANVIFSQTFDGTYDGVMSGGGSLTKEGAGTLVLTGVNSFTGGTSVIGGQLAVNGSLASGVTIGSGTLGGVGVIGGSVVNAGVLAPGNSIGTLTVNGNYTQAAGGSYQVEVNAAGQNDRLNVGGTAQLGGTVGVLAAPGNYARSTTYTILNATGGVNGSFAGPTSNFAFLAPSLAYDSNNVYLTLTTDFSDGGETPNEEATGGAIDTAAPSASGDFATVLRALSGLNTLQGPAALNAISGQNYAGFSNVLVQRAQLFMNSFAARAGGGSGGGSMRTALAEACTVACETATPGPWSVWASALGGAGTIAGNANAGAVTYNMMSFAAGLDRQITPILALGVTVGYLGGSQWTEGFDGSGTSDGVLAALYALYRDGGLYLDAVAGYSYTDNRLRRTIVIPGLTARVATGATGANQFFGQAETGYRFDLGMSARASVTPFARLQGSTATQNGFTESGADSLNLSVAPQTTSSLRTVLGAQLGAKLEMGWLEPLAVQLRLGWSHEYADTQRPVTASLGGAPFVPFSVQGAAPQRDGALIGLSADTAVAASTSLYFRYEGNIAGQDSSHALALGLRLNW